MSNITLPYSINRIDGHSSGYVKGTYNFTTTINLYKIQPTYLWFQHADQSADIYVDDVKVTTHWGGYNAFFTDITNYIHVGTNNIKVAVCNLTRNALAPSAGDFNFNATLGKVKLLTSPVLPSIDYGYDGFHILATDVSQSSATLTVKTKIPIGATVICKIDDTNYHYKEKKPSTGNEMSFTATISNPTLWNGTINPHLYKVTLEIYKNGDLYHKFERDYGIRYYSYVFNQPGYIENLNYTGFLLNGSPYKLRGVCMHHDLEGKANALTDSDIEHDFDIIQELGCNFIRLAHYPHPKEVYDWCDKLGIIVQTEVPCVNRFNSPEVSGTNCPQEYYDHLDIQYEDMVRQHFNHPCILFWGLFNEASTNDSTWAKTKLEYYRTLIKNIDPERWVGYVVAQGSSNPSSTFGNPNMDWFGCNIYVGWYANNGQSNGSLSNDPTSQINSRVNNIITGKLKPLAYSEYGCGGNQRCHSINPFETTQRGNYPRHDIEYMMWLHEGHLAAIRNFPQLLFTGEWQLFDIAVSSRTEGYKVCLDGETVSDDNSYKYLNDKGLVMRDHTTKKDTFYLYKAEWNKTDKFVHICGKEYIKNRSRVIKCYTNETGTLKLYVNDELIETKEIVNNIVEFTAMDFELNDVVRVDSISKSDTFTFTEIANLPEPIDESSSEDDGPEEIPDESESSDGGEEFSHDYSKDYFTIESVEDGNTITVVKNNSPKNPTIYYSLDDGVTWSNQTLSSGVITLGTLDANEKMIVKCDINSWSTAYNKYNNFAGSKKFKVYGNIMSLLNGENFISNSEFAETSSYELCGLFYGTTTLIDASNLILPALTIHVSSYNGLFRGCTNLEHGPKLLPALDLPTDAYSSMFEGCVKLVESPEILATTVSGTAVFNRMFCMSRNSKVTAAMTKSPVLRIVDPAAYSNVYQQLFAGNGNITEITILAEGTNLSFLNWLANTSSVGVIKKLSGTTLATGASGVPSGWTTEDYVAS